MCNWNEYREIRKKYFGENRLDSKYNYKRYMEAKMHTKTLNIPTATGLHQINLDPYYSLAPCTGSTSCPAAIPSFFGRPVQKQEEENLMNYASASISTPATEAQDQRKYLERRLGEVYNDRREGLEAKFGLTDDNSPVGPTELAERIAAGKFIIRGTGDDAKNAERYRYWSAYDLIQWRDPAKKADQDGFDAARKDLKAKRQAALDTIKIDDPKAGLDAIKALEAWPPTGAAN